MRVSANDHAAVHAKTGQEHLHLRSSGILRLIENDEGISQRASAHEGDRGDFDFARSDAAFDLFGWQAVVQRIVNRPQIGVYLFLHVAG